VLLLAACSRDVEKPLRVGSNQWIGYEPVYLAREMGYLEGTDIHLIELRSATQVMGSLRMGNLEVAMLTLDEALTVMQDNVPLSVIAIMDISNGADVMLARPGMSLETLRGKRIGVENTALGAVVLEGALAKAGLSIEDIQIVPCRADDHEAMYLKGRVDAVVTFEPVRTRLLKMGARQIFDSSDIPNQIIDVMVVRTDIEDRHRQQLRKLIESYFRALDYLEKYPQEAIRKMAPRMKISEEELQQAYKGVELPTLAMTRSWLDSERLKKQAVALEDLMRRRHLIEHHFQLEGIANPRYLPSGD
jgi:NitT/TauT family transport system substrate-binding protein